MSHDPNDQPSRPPAPKANLLRRAFARLAPQEVPVAVSEERGIRYLHFGSEAIQGAMRIADPIKLELEYTRDMVAAVLLPAAIKRIAVLGLGAGSVTKWLHAHCDGADITTVELSPAVIQVAQGFFALPPEGKRFRVLQADGEVFLNEASSAKNSAPFDLLLVDVYDAAAKGPVLSSPAFYAACASRVGATGVLSVNLFGKHTSYETNLRNIRRAFDGRCFALPASERGNVIAIAWGEDVSLTRQQLRERAREWHARTGVAFVRYGGMMAQADCVLP
jgi:spermidine synthase